MLLLLSCITGCVAGEEVLAPISWKDQLPKWLSSSILWFADHEEGTFQDWEDEGTDDFFAGGGIFLTDTANASASICPHPVHSGRYAAQATIQAAWQCQNGNKAVRLMRWTDKPWDEGGDYFPEEAYYSTWMYFPAAYNPNKQPAWDPGDGGWWNVFQFKSDDFQGVSQPVWVLNVATEEKTNAMFFYLYSKYNPPFSFEAFSFLPIPVGKWVHVEAFYRKSTPNQSDGHIILWQDGQELFNIPGVVTAFSEQTAWGIGNYTDHIAGGKTPGEATLFFDDAAVSLLQLSQNLGKGE